MVPYHAEITVERAQNKLALRFVRNDGRRMTILIEPKEAAGLVLELLTELLRK